MGMRVVLFKAITALSAGLTATSAWAATANDFVLESKKVIRELRHSGILPSVVVGELEEVDFVITSDFRKSSGATRSSAFADPKNQRVLVNKDAVFNGDLRTLAIHEALSAIGWRDTNYESSIVVSLLLKDNRQNFIPNDVRQSYTGLLKRESIKNAINYRIPDSDRIDYENGRLQTGRESGGGVVLVGGGGDLRSAQMKEMLLQKYLTSLKSNPGFQKRHLRNFVEGVKIESVKSQQAGVDPFARVRVVSIYNRKRKLYERTFYVPTSMEKEAALRSMWRFLIQVGYQKNPDQVYDLLIPRTAMQWIEYRREKGLTGK